MSETYLLLKGNYPPGDDPHFDFSDVIAEIEIEDPDGAESQEAEDKVEEVFHDLYPNYALVGSDVGLWNVVYGGNLMFDLYLLPKDEFDFSTMNGDVDPCDLEDIRAAEEEDDAAMQGEIDYDSDYDEVNDNPAPPVGKVTYLATMPRERKPRAVPKGSIGWFQQNAREFYEAPGMTAAQARQAIKDGTLKPTWIKGQPVVAYSTDGKPRVETRPSLGMLIKEVDQKKATNVALRIGNDVYEPHWAPRGYTYDDRLNFSWHKVTLAGFTYDPNPITLRDLERHLRNKDSFELAYLQEDYSGMSMAALVVLARSGRTFEFINDETMRRRLSDLQGRKFRATKVIEGGQLREADLVWS